METQKKKLLTVYVDAPIDHKKWAEVGPREEVRMDGAIPSEASWVKQVVADLLSGKLKYDRRR